MAINRELETELEVEPMTETYVLLGDDKEIWCISIILGAIERHLESKRECERVLKYISSKVLNES